MPTPDALTIFGDALGIDPAERERFIDHAAAGDAGLADEVSRLLLAHQWADRIAFLDSHERGDLQQGDRLGVYTVVRPLGRGGMGDVYLARADNAHAPVALKVIRGDAHTPRARRRFEREAKLLARLDHPGIARVYGADTDGDRPYLAMEYVKGVDLIAHAEQHALDSSDRLRLVAHVCDAVQHAYEQGVVHRDLKPTNILVDARGRPRVLDFGIACSIRADSLTSITHRDTRNLIGTLRYMSPEQCAGDPAAIDHRTDIHALGVIAYELLSGEHPYRIADDTPLPEIARRIRDEAPRPLPARDRALALIIGKAIATEPGHRYASAAEFAADIRRHLCLAPIRARRAPAAYRAARLARRHRAAVALNAALLTLVVGLIATGWQWRRASLNEDKIAKAFQSVGLLDFRTNESPAAYRRRIDDVAAVLLGVELDDEYTQMSGDRFGIAYQRVGAHEAALPHFRGALDLSRRIHGPEHNKTLRAANIYIDSLIGAGEVGKAEAIARSTLAEAGLPGPEQIAESWLTESADLDDTGITARRSPALRALKFAVQTGKAMHAQRRHHEAESLLRAALAAIRRWSVGVPRPERYDEHDATTALAIVLIDSGKDLDVAERLLDEVIRTGCPAGEDPLSRLELSAAHIALADIFARTARESEADRLLPRMIDLRGRFILPDNAGTRRAKSVLARLRQSGHNSGAMLLQ